MHTASFWDDVPRFGKQGERWLRREVYLAIEAWAAKHRPLQRITDEVIATAAAHLVETCGRGLLVWANEPQYRGRDYATGHWELDHEALAPQIGAALDHARQILSAALPPAPAAAPCTEADVEAALAAALAPLPSGATAPKEQPGWLLLDGSAEQRFRRMRGRIKARRVVACRVCGADAQGAARCPKCRTAKRQRCAHCEQEFTTQHCKERSCPSCRHSDPKHRRGAAS